MVKRNVSRFLASKKGIILVGACIGVLASTLQKFGNPTNMGICVACFLRDISGALGFHRAGVVQYMRPEIIGFILGSTITSLIYKEFKARNGSAPLVRFCLGACAMIGALAFLGCPWRTVLRLAGGDLNAILGLLGLTTGIAIGDQFLKYGYNLGKTTKTYVAGGFIVPFFALLFLVLLFFKSKGILFFSTKGPGAMHACIGISILFGLIIGFLLQRTRFCTMGSIRDVLLVGDVHLMSGLISLFIFAFLTNLLYGQVHFGFRLQPIAHTAHIWNFLGMTLAGLAFVLAGGCPGRQLILSGEGDMDAGVFVLGMIAGAGFAHNFGLAGVPDKLINNVVQVGGISLSGKIVVVSGILFCMMIGYFMREKI